MIVYGDRESPENLSVRDRGGEQYQVGLVDFVRESPNQQPSSSPANRARRRPRLG